MKKKNVETKLDLKELKFILKNRERATNIIGYDGLQKIAQRIVELYLEGKLTKEDETFLMGSIPADMFISWLMVEKFDEEKLEKIEAFLRTQSKAYAIRCMMLMIQKTKDLNLRSYLLDKIDPKDINSQMISWIIPFLVHNGRYIKKLLQIVTEMAQRGDQEIFMKINYEDWDYLATAMHGSKSIQHNAILIAETILKLKRNECANRGIAQMAGSLFYYDLNIESTTRILSQNPYMFHDALPIQRSQYPKEVIEVMIRLIENPKAGDFNISLYRAPEVVKFEHIQRMMDGCYKNGNHKDKISLDVLSNAWGNRIGALYERNNLFHEYIDRILSINYTQWNELESFVINCKYLRDFAETVITKKLLDKVISAKKLDQNLINALLAMHEILKRQSEVLTITGLIEMKGVMPNLAIHEILKQQSEVLTITGLIEMKGVMPNVDPYSLFQLHQVFEFSTALLSKSIRRKVDDLLKVKQIMASIKE